jgi:excinuclease ABC subunit C
MAHFGSLKRLRQADVADVMSVPGIGPQTAAAVVEAVHRDDGPVAVNTATGEVLD